MDPLEKFEALARTARSEETPIRDVWPAVRARLARGPEPSLAPVIVFAEVAALAAAAVLVLAAFSGSSLDESLFRLLPVLEFAL